MANNLKFKILAIVIVILVCIYGIVGLPKSTAELAANWNFQVSEISSVGGYVRATRKWVAVYAILPLFLLLAAIDLVHARSAAVLFHFAFGVTASALLRMGPAWKPTRPAGRRASGGRR